MTVDQLKGCLAGGAIGDGLGSAYEQQSGIVAVDFDIPWQITDDTQLTLATCEAILEAGAVAPETIAANLRSGEFAAGNGAAMRIAPLAFFLSPDADRQLIRDVCWITHRNDEAYRGCLAVLYAMRAALTNEPVDVDLIAEQLPDTLMQENLLRLGEMGGIREAAELIGCGGHVVQSVPLAIFAVGQLGALSFEEVLRQVIMCGGDTDTNASIAGQIMGASLGYSALPGDLVARFLRLPESGLILEVADQFGQSNID